MDRYERILESIEDPVVVIDKTGNPLYMNQAGYILKSQIGSHSFKSLINYPLGLNFVKKGMSVKGIFFESKDSKFLIDIFPLEEEGFTLLIRDITRFIEMEETAKKEGIIITISKLLSTIFHDMKGPVGGIKGAAQLLKEDIQDIELVDDILYEVKRIENLINEITVITKPIKLFKKYASIHKVIDEAIKTVEKQYKQVRYERVYDPSLPDLYIDPDYMHRVFVNIIRNGIEAVGGKGKITISTGISWDKIYSPKGNKVYVRIKDSGKGVPEDMIDKLFIPFVSGKKGGMGIGLSSSYKIVKEHGGILRYIGKATFEILLPIPERGEK
ncbi:histidine kinase [Persephonella atlantica]|uniref:histidine kinase n=2 Tax=Persephonella atlantica TaxID=2699429 RepID=A0ABS1GF77_9AQUI|nr:ATP-binding protein [Persephonella atlantica]MBK3331583.1 histidine kinase [Persephonella atlantica]